MSKERLEEIKNKFDLDRINRFVDSKLISPSDLTYLIQQAEEKIPLEERVKQLEKENRSFKNRNKHLDFRLGESRKQCNRFKQALDKIAKLPYDYVMQRIARQALEGGNADD